jgi:hypothetical protein
MKNNNDRKKAKTLKIKKPADPPKPYPLIPCPLGIIINSIKNVFCK